VNEDLRRAFAFVANGDMGGARSEVLRFGLAVFDEELPLRYELNPRATGTEVRVPRSGVLAGLRGGSVPSRPVRSRPGPRRR